jgi:hypothetical protein
MADPTDVEVRGYFPREIVDVLDACVQAKPGSSRVALIQEILAGWVRQKKHESMLVYRMTRGKGNDLELVPRSDGNGFPVARNGDSDG